MATNTTVYEARGLRVPYWVVSDMYGTWCRDCGNSVYTAINGHRLVCATPDCEHYDFSLVPDWVKKLFNLKETN